ncbi:MAG TPA: thymidine kinase [Polyangiaceae bacterium]|nr:thymidine kinase [Polyangiaceae bacterium]
MSPNLAVGGRAGYAALVAKLYFRHGTMSSAKTLNLLAVAHNYRSQGKRVLLIKPRLDTRFSGEAIVSRSGLEAQADLLVGPETRLEPGLFEGLHCVLVDEAQFLSPAIVEQLRRVTLSHNVPVICYGLRTDFQTRLFEGSKRLLELADSIEEVKVTCQFCNRKAIFNMRLIDGRPTLEGQQVMLGADESYAPTCCTCFAARLPL